MSEDWNLKLAALINTSFTRQGEGIGKSAAALIRLGNAYRVACSAMVVASTTVFGNTLRTALMADDMGGEP